MKKERKLQLGKITIQDLISLKEKELEKINGGSDVGQQGTTNIPIFC
jgi:hypothetical protein